MNADEATLFLLSTGTDVRIPIKFDLLQTGWKLVEFVVALKQLSTVPFLIFNGALIDSWLSLAYQGIKSGDSIVVYDVSFRESVSDLDEVDYLAQDFEERVESVWIESMKIEDRILTAVDICGKTESLYRQIEALSEQQEEPERKEETVIGESAIGVDPLPALVGAGEGAPAWKQQISSVDENSRCCGKNQFSEWSW